MASLQQYQKHVDRFGHEAVMFTASTDSDMSDRDVKALASYIAKTAKSVIKPGKGKKGK